MKTIIEYFIGFICIMLICLFFIFCGYSYYHTRTNVIYLENSEDLKTLFPKGTSNVSYFGKYGW
ncbi:MAG: hypothetical protein LBC02_13955, partial [Planctomycetaceae bacterium]|nr:hypothetical protein [Planctomycetaceae bacterium]